MTKSITPTSNEAKSSQPAGQSEKTDFPVAQTSGSKEAGPTAGPILDPLFNGHIPLPWDIKTTDWNETLYCAVAESDLPEAPFDDNLGILCPNWPTLTRAKRVRFLMNLIAMIAKFESAWNPESTYREPAPVNNLSIGLLQLSYEDEVNYPPKFGLNHTTRKLTDPKINIQFGVKIMNALVKHHKQFCGKNSHGHWVGLSAYWSTMRSTGKPYGLIARYVIQVKL